MLINSTWNKEELYEEGKESIIIHIYMKDVKKLVVIIETCHFYQHHTKFYPTSCSQD